MRIPVRVAAPALAAVLTFGLVACGSDGAEVTGPGAEGARVAQDRGCTSCHGGDGGGGIGPTWQGLAGSEVELDDGTTVTADEDYLRRAIVDPGAEVVEGYGIPMPEVSLTDDEVDALVTYIETLAEA